MNICWYILASGANPVRHARLTYDPSDAPIPPYKRMPSMSSNELSALSSTLSGCDALKLLEIIRRCTDCVSENEFTGLFPSIRELCPIDFAIALLGGVSSNRFAAVGGVQINLPEHFSRAYVANNYIQTDALVKESAITQRVQYWPDSWERLGQRHEIVSLCMDNNMNTGFIHGSKPNSLTKKGGLFCFSGLSMPNDKRTVAIIRLVVPHLHLSLSRIFNGMPSADKVITLSDREKDVLNWLKQGKSSWDVSVILGVSERTVNYHVYNIMHKLEAVNRPQAVAVAVHLGLIDVD
jgi:LuxR family transcriptional regulator, quorum-sensing system regulator CviR